MQYSIHDRLDLCNLPVGHAGEPLGVHRPDFKKIILAHTFQALETSCQGHSVNAEDSNQTVLVSNTVGRFLSYEGEDYPYLTVISEINAQNLFGFFSV